MSLDWNAEAVVGINEMEKDEVTGASVANFCWALMAVGVGRVTEANANEVFVRIQIWEALYGPIRYHYNEENKTRKSIYGNLDFVKSMVGYSTNVSNETMLKWTKRITSRRVDELASADRF
jgi:hypothetical protein